MTGITANISREYGQKIYRTKCNIITFNMNNKPEQIKGINVGDRLKYLGISINDSKNCFMEQKKLVLEKARRITNLTCPVIARNCSGVDGNDILENCRLTINIVWVNIVDLDKKRNK